LHQGKLADIITQNFADISNIYNSSTLSTTKPIIESETGEGKRAVKHENYGFFKEQCILKLVQLSISTKNRYFKILYIYLYTYNSLGYFWRKDLYKK